MSDCRFGVSPVNYPDPDPGRIWLSVRDNCGHPYSNIETEGGKSSHESGILRRLPNAKIAFGALIKMFERSNSF